MQIAGYTYIAHTVANRDWGPICQFTVARPDDGSHVNAQITIPSLSMTTQELIPFVETYLVALTAYEADQALYSHVFDHVGEEIKEALFWLIEKIRQFPGATLAQAETQWNTQWADSIFDFDRFVMHVRRLADDVTWDQFKTFVINRKFEGLD